MRRKLGRLAVIVVATGLIAIVGLYLRDMRRAYERISGKSTTIASSLGAIEYTEGGKGTPVLVIHGSGGGFDQGELIVDAVLGNDFHWITPSRFGYLGSGVPDGATFDHQAHAFAHLLDHLEIETVAVVALSHGGPSALLFAVLYPDRVSSLTCLSCGVAASKSEDQAGADRKGRALRFVYAHDYTYWPLARFFKSQFMGMLGAGPGVVATLSPGQREMIERIIDYMNPAAPRSAGVVLDNEAVLPGERIAAIRVPTLVVHARDDLLQLYRNAEFAAATIPDVRLMTFDSGGHVVLAVEREAIRAAVRGHILQNAHRSTDPR